MEPQKRAKHSKSLDPDKIEEVLMDEESDEELEDEVMEPRIESSSSSEDENDVEETEVCFSGCYSRGFVKFFEFYWASKWR